LNYSEYDEPNHTYAPNGRKLVIHFDVRTRDIA
jgi:hypothetical protein